MTIVIQCTDQIGLVTSITGVLAKLGINILSMREYVDVVGNRFFTRIEIVPFKDVQRLERYLTAVLPVNASCTVIPVHEKRIIVLATKEYHCLSDILVRHHFKTLGAAVQVVIANHQHLNDITGRFNVHFVHVTHENKSKEQFEYELANIIDQYAFDYIVLAKFMRILSPQFVEKYFGKIINIHHSFLPAFVGAHPYKQAFERGVKLIGATAHFVTNDLDEGPIIAQQTIAVNHSFTLPKIVNAGKEIETAVLARALQLVMEDRVFVYQNKTVVFE
jgi:formyltetrahydrofolate deformylase